MSMPSRRLEPVAQRARPRIGKRVILDAPRPAGCSKTSAALGGRYPQTPCWHRWPGRPPAHPSPDRTTCQYKGQAC
jgi:hypothetical protein